MRATSRIRNVVLVGPSGSGKTTLAEMLLAHAGAIPRAGSVEAGNTVTDSDESEIRQGRSVSLAVASFEHAGMRLNLIDTPGYADFVGEVRAGLRGADAALFVVSAVQGVDAATGMLWEECDAVGMPRAIVVTHLDNPRADFDAIVLICQRVFGEGVQPVHLPMMADDGSLGGIIDLISQQVADLTGPDRETRAADPEHEELIENARGALLEGIIAESEDETLMDRYVGGEDLDLDVVVADLEKAVARGSFFPVLPAALDPARFGCAEVLDLIERGFPAPAEHPVPPTTTPDGVPVAPLAADPDGPLCAEVIKTTSDPYVGRISLVRVFSGTLRPEAVLHVSGHFSGADGRGRLDHDVDERSGVVSGILGATLNPIEAAVAGDIVAVAKLAHAETGDTLSSKESPLLMEPWVMPDPLLPVGITAHTRADEDKLTGALARLVAEDPTLRLQRDGAQIILWCMGEAHIDVVLERLRKRYGVSVDSVPVQVALRETFARPGNGHGRLVKQSGGHGQFAICDITVEPLPMGSGFEFVDKVVGGAIPRNFIPSVEKGIRAQMEKGLAAGFPVVDIRVTLTDGKAHSVDSSDMAFQSAGALALRDAAGLGAEAKGAALDAIAILEPVDAVEVTVSDEYVGAVMGDLSGRRGRVTGSEPSGSGRTVIRAEVPATELTRYAVDLRSLSHGTATFHREYQGHEPMPPRVAQKVLAAATT